MPGGNTKNLRYPSSYVDIDTGEIFDPTNLDVDGLEDVYDIDIEKIGQDANTLAAGVINNLLKMYKNKEFTDTHPEWKKRVDAEIESLRKLFKMTNINETLMDHLATAIASQPNNASLYTAMTRLQDKMMDFDKEIREILNEFNALITSYQMEMDFTKDMEKEEEEESGNMTCRGGKAFVELMSEENDKNNEEVLKELKEPIE